MMRPPSIGPHRRARHVAQQLARRVRAAGGRRRALLPWRATRSMVAGTTLVTSLPSCICDLDGSRCAAVGRGPGTALRSPGLRRCPGRPAAWRCGRCGTAGSGRALDQRRIGVAQRIGAVAARQQHMVVVAGHDARRGGQGVLVDHDRLAQEGLDQAGLERRQRHARQRLVARARRQLDGAARCRCRRGSTGARGRRSCPGRAPGPGRCGADS